MLDSSSTSGSSSATRTLPPGTIALSYVPHGFSLDPAVEEVFLHPPLAVSPSTSSGQALPNHRDTTLANQARL